MSAPRLSIVPPFGAAKRRKAPHFSAPDLRALLARLGNSVDDAGKLAAVGTTLAKGALDLRRQSASLEDQEIVDALIEWLGEHTQEINTARAAGVTYYKMADLREAVDEAITEFESAVDQTGAGQVADAICDRIDRILAGGSPSAPAVIGDAPSTPLSYAVMPERSWAFLTGGLLLLGGILLGLVLGRRRSV